jgi:SlyX protein|tara:strand:- start:47 stop:265 length:219 start_codon:yes stop_codon:yes gene_type:complete
MSSESQDRLTELEIQLAHVQRLYEQLNEVVTSQSKEIDRFERRFHQLQTQYKELKERPERGFDPVDEKPPHY